MRRAGAYPPVLPAFLALLLLQLHAPLAAAVFDPTAWRGRKPITLAATGARYAEAPLDGEVYRHAALSLADLRVVTADGTEVPYLVRRWPGTESMREVSGPPVNLAVQPRRLTRFELHTAGAGERHNQLVITAGDERYPPRVVTVEGSDDRRNWLRLARGEIYRLPPTAQERVDYPLSLFRFVRVTIHDDGRPPLRIGRAALRVRRTVPAREDRWFAGPVRVVTDPQTRTTAVTVDAGFARLPLGRMVLLVSAPGAFVREATVEVADDGVPWAVVGEATLVRSEQARRDVPLSVAFPESRGRRVRLTIRNGDSPPLVIGRGALYGVQRTVLFPVTPGTRYWLYLDGPADAPSYDLPEVLRREASPPRPVVAALGPLQPNPAYRPPRRPWTEEHPALLWTILVVVGVVLAVVIVGTFRATSPRQAR